MKKRLLPMFLACCMLASLLTVTAWADGAPLYVEYSDGDGVYALPGESGIGWDFQESAVLTLNNFQGNYIAFQFDVPMYGNMEISLSNDSVNTMKHLISSLEGELTIKGNGMLLIKSDDNDPAVNLYESTLKIAGALRMIGGTKEGDKNPLTIRDGKAVTSDGKAATYVVFVPSGSEGDIPAFPSDGANLAERKEFPDTPSGISYTTLFQSTGYAVNPVGGSGTAQGITAFSNTVRLYDNNERGSNSTYRLAEYTGNGIQEISEPYKSISDFTESGHAYVEGLNGSGRGVIDNKGKQVIDSKTGKPISTSRRQMSDDGYAVGYAETGALPVFSAWNLKDGVAVQFGKNELGTYGGYNNGLIPFQPSNGDASWKYLDINGNVVIDTQITDHYANQDLGTYAAATFSNGYAIIHKTTNGKRVYGIIDTTGKETFLDTNKKYQEIGSVSAGGLAVAKVAQDVYDYIDVYGNVVIPGGYYKAAKFYNGYAVVNRNSDKFYETEEVVSGRKIYKNSGGCGIIDTAGRVVIPFGIYDYITNVSDTGLVWASRTYHEQEMEIKYTLEVLKISVPPTQFSDVPEGAYYVDAVKWAVDKGVTNGVSATNFAPADICSRGQVATFLWRANGKPEPVTTENPFTDVDPSSAFYKAILWAAENGITAGTSDTTFSPGNPCTRAHVVTFLWRAQGKPAPSGDGSLADSFPQGYYTDAVRWADAAGLLDGTGEAFTPSALCPRADIVTYLYRNLA